MSKTCFVIVGPTAVGKTACAIDLAKMLGTEIISADSRQCYRELDIGVAKPTPSQLQSVRHHFINSHSIIEEVNAAVFERYALSAVEGIFQKHDTAVLVGGTGLYVNAFCYGLDEIPVVKQGLREQLLQSYEDKGLEWLQEQVKLQDPDYFQHGERFNPQRLMRALEVRLSTGRSIRSFHTSRNNNRGFSIIKAGLELPREVLYQRIELRVEEMIEAGLKHEAAQLINFRQLNSLNTVGYKEMFACIDGTMSLNDSIALIKKNTRHYAKRQLTWFKKDAETQWFPPQARKEILELSGL